MKITQKYNDLLVALWSSNPTKDAKAILIADNTIHGIMEQFCNEPMTEATEKRLNWIVKRCLLRARKLLPMLWDCIWINEDPRGYSLKVDNEIFRIYQSKWMRSDLGGYGVLSFDAYKN